MPKKRRTSSKSSVLRRKAEALVGPLDEERVPTDPDEVCGLVHELRTHQIELELQNDELACTQEALMASRDGYARLYDDAPIGFMTLDDEGCIVQSNLTLANALGVKHGDLIDSRFSDWVVDEDQDDWHLQRRASLKDGLFSPCEIRVRRSDGEPLWMRITAVAAPGVDDGPRWFCSLGDVTQRRLAETEREAALADARRRADETAALLEGHRALLVGGPFPRIAGKLLDACNDLVGGAAGCVALLEEGDPAGRIDVCATTGLDTMVFPVQTGSLSDVER